jgi:hypothetical protein
MLYCFHDSNRAKTAGGDQRAFACLGGVDSRSVGWLEDSSAASDDRRTAARMDFRRFGLDAHELEPMGSSRKCRRCRCVKGQAKAWTTSPIDRKAFRRIGESLRPLSSGVRIEPGSMGWSHSGSTSTATVWDKAEGTASAELDAPVRVPPEACQLHILAGEDRGRQKISEGFKKNLKP